MDQAHQILNDVFGFSAFRLAQEAVIHRLLVDNHNALVLFPTGGGKSLTFQVPALCLEGLTVVISPLIALMSDQVDSLTRRGVKAAKLDSTLDAATYSWVKNEVLSGDMKILYVAPERLNNEGFVHMMKRVRISLLAVDESHCISQWGASFRPEYLKIARFAKELEAERVLCLTATATKGVQTDICKGFDIDPEHGVFRTPVFRPNLGFEVEIAQNMDHKLKRLVPFLKSRTGPAIVYVTLQKHAEDTANILRVHDLEAMVYHAGLPKETRDSVQNKFMQGDRGIVVATIAFGMGIDKNNIRQVVHFYMPKSLEGYSQEVGRAGRDGLDSTCLLFLCAEDLATLHSFAKADTVSRTNLRLWFQEVAFKEPATDGTINFNHYKQSKDYDIRPTVLSLLYAQLELDYNYIRAVTPFYSFYDITPGSSAGWAKVMADKSPAAKIIRQGWKSKGQGYQIDVEEVAERSGNDRAQLAATINNWDLEGNITIKASQVRARYRLLDKPLPKSSEEVKELVDSLFERMIKREQEDSQRIQQVINFATNDDCLAQTLADYFGDNDVVPTGFCGKCTFCKTLEPVQFSQTAKVIPDPKKILAILAACPERDDPRLLARLAFGMTSPRLTAGKYSSHALFGSMAEDDFDLLVQAFDEECKKMNYMRDANYVAPVTGKRSRAPTSSTGGTRGGGRGSSRGSYKRGKR